MALGFISRPNVVFYLRSSPLFYLRIPPLHLCLSCTHRDGVVLHLCLDISLLLPPLLPHIYSASFYITRSFFPSVCLSLFQYILVSCIELFTPILFLYDNHSISFIISPAGVQLSFMMFFKRGLRKRFHSNYSISLPLCFHSELLFGPIPGITTSWAYAPVFQLSLFLILMTNSNLIISILNNSFEALISSMHPKLFLPWSCA